MTRSARRAASATSTVKESRSSGADPVCAATVATSRSCAPSTGSEATTAYPCVSARLAQLAPIAPAPMTAIVRTSAGSIKVAITCRLALDPWSVGLQAANLPLRGVLAAVAPVPRATGAARRLGRRPHRELALRARRRRGARRHRLRGAVGRRTAAHLHGPAHPALGRGEPARQVSPSASRGGIPRSDGPWARRGARRSLRDSSPPARRTSAGGSARVRSRSPRWPRRSRSGCARASSRRRSHVDDGRLTSMCRPLRAVSGGSRSRSAGRR